MNTQDRLGSLTEKEEISKNKELKSRDKKKYKTLLDNIDPFEGFFSEEELEEVGDRFVQEQIDISRGK